MPKSLVVLLNTEDGRSLVKKTCRAEGLTLSTLEQLIAAEADQQGKQKKIGLWEEFDEIFDDIAPVGEN